MARNCLDLLKASAVKEGSKYWLQHLDQWRTDSSAVVEAFKLRPQVSQFLAQMCAALNSLGKVEVAIRTLPTCCKLLSQFAANIAILTHRDACENLVKCIDFFLVKTPASAVAEQSQRWAARLLVAIGKVLQQVRDLEEWNSEDRQPHFLDLICNPREWKPKEQLYAVKPPSVPEDLNYLLDTCLLFVCLQRRSPLITYILSCLVQLNLATSNLMTFLEQLNVLMKSSEEYSGQFWWAVKTKLWECHVAAFEREILQYANDFVKEDNIVPHSQPAVLRLHDNGLIAACTQSFALCYRASMMLRQLCVASNHHFFMDAATRCFHLTLKEHASIVGKQTTFCLEDLYAKEIAAVASITVQPVSSYDLASLKAILASLASVTAAVLRIDTLPATAAPRLYCVVDEIRCLFVDQQDWYWACLIVAASDSKMASLCLDIPLFVHVAATTAHHAMHQCLQSISDEKSQICSALKTHCSEPGLSTGVSLSTKHLSTDCIAKLPAVTRYTSVAGLATLLRVLIAGSSSEQLIDVLKMLSPSATVRLELLSLVMHALDLQYWKRMNVLSASSLQFASAALKQCVNELSASDNLPGTASPAVALLGFKLADFVGRLAGAASSNSI